MGEGESPPFGRRLRQLRESAGLTQEELAERAGLSAKAIGALERGRRQRPYPHTVRALAEALGLSEEDRAELAGAMPARIRAAYEPRRAQPTLPTPPTPLIGRDRDSTEVTSLLTRGGVRLVTLTGAGGVGKSRLALEVATRLSGAFSGRVAFVPLAPLSDPALVLPAVAQTLGLTEVGNTSTEEMLIAYLGDDAWLLVLDNFEHVLDAAPEVADVLGACRNLAVLVTSRAPLKVRAEQEYPVRPLALPEPDDAPTPAEIAHVTSVQLFLERAQAAVPGFALAPANSGAVAAICRRLDGLPLALELAAARVRVLSPAELLSRLDHLLPLLVGGSRDLPQRQQTMQAAINWSYELLRPEEQALFRRLAAFAGGWTLDAAEWVAAWGAVVAEEIVELLSGLVEQSLVVADMRPEGVTRYRMLEPIRQFAARRAEETGESAELADRHLAWSLAFAQRTAPELRGPDQQRWLDRLEQEHDNLRAALAWSERGASRRSAGLELATALWRFWETRGHLTEGRRWLERALAGSGDAPPHLRAAGLNAAGNLARDQGDHGQAISLHEASLALRRELADTYGSAQSLNNLGNLRLDQGAYRQATTLYEEALTLFQELGFEWDIANALNNLGIALGYRGAYERATRLLGEAIAIRQRLGESLSRARSIDALGVVLQKQADLDRAAALHMESLALRRDLGDLHGMAISLHNLGLAAGYRGNDEEAVRLIDESLRLRRIVGDEFGIAIALSALAAMARHQGDSERSRSLYTEAIAMRQQLRTMEGLPECLLGLAAIAAAAGNGERAARLLGASDALRQSMDQALPPIDRADYERTVAAIEAATTPDDFERLRSEGRAMTLDQVIAL